MSSKAILGDGTVRNEPLNDDAVYYPTLNYHFLNRRFLSDQSLNDSIWNDSGIEDILSQVAQPLSSQLEAESRRIGMLEQTDSSSSDPFSVGQASWAMPTEEPRLSKLLRFSLEEAAGDDEGLVGQAGPSSQVPPLISVTSSVGSRRSRLGKRKAIEEDDGDFVPEEEKSKPVVKKQKTQTPVEDASSKRAGMTRTTQGTIADFEPTVELMRMVDREDNVVQVHLRASFKLSGRVEGDRALKPRNVYKRNFLEVTDASYHLEAPQTYRRSDLYLETDEGDGSRRIVALSVHISAHDEDHEGADVGLEQYIDSRRQNKIINILPMFCQRPNVPEFADTAKKAALDQQNDFFRHSLTPSVDGKDSTSWTRASFRKATEHNGRRRAKQSYFVLCLSLVATLDDQTEVKVAVRSSEKFVVTARSPAGIKRGPSALPISNIKIEADEGSEDEADETQGVHQQYSAPTTRSKSSRRRPTIHPAVQVQSDMTKMSQRAAATRHISMGRQEQNNPWFDRSVEVPRDRYVHSSLQRPGQPSASTSIPAKSCATHYRAQPNPAFHSEFFPQQSDNPLSHGHQYRPSNVPANQNRAVAQAMLRLQGPRPGHLSLVTSHPSSVNGYVNSAAGQLHHVGQHSPYQSAFEQAIPRSMASRTTRAAHEMFMNAAANNPVPSTPSGNYTGHNVHAEQTPYSATRVSSTPATESSEYNFNPDDFVTHQVRTELFSGLGRLQLPNSDPYDLTSHAQPLASHLHPPSGVVNNARTEPGLGTRINSNMTLPAMESSIFSPVGFDQMGTRFSEITADHVDTANEMSAEGEEKDDAASIGEENIDPEEYARILDELSQESITF